jgi:hypothetical protein
VLQNINGRSSNGLLVGPEFSRMMAEILLQQIDSEVYLSLTAEGLKKDVDYTVYRYVDDIFVFTKSPEMLDTIIGRFSSHGEKYLLRLNETKLTKDATPCVPKSWLSKTRVLSDEIDHIFLNKKKAEYDNLSDDEKFIVKSEFIKVDRLKDEITLAMKEHPDDRRTIVSFLLSTLLNNIGKKRLGYTLFEKSKTGKSLLLLDLALFIYSYYPNFDQTRKIISMIVYMDDEVNFKGTLLNKRKLKNTINRYAFAFQRGNIFDLCDWFPFMREYGISFEVKAEEALLTKASQAKNPIVWANLLVYSSYCSHLFEEVRNTVDKVIDEQIMRISDKEIMLHEEFWFVLIFHNCPHISMVNKTALSKVVDDVFSGVSSNPKRHPSGKATMLMCEFLRRTNDGGQKSEDSFFNWGNTTGISAMITYRTFQRTIFKRYQRSKYSLYVSLD